MLNLTEAIKNKSIITFGFQLSIIIIGPLAMECFTPSISWLALPTHIHTHTQYLFVFILDRGRGLSANYFGPVTIHSTTMIHSSNTKIIAYTLGGVKITEMVFLLQLTCWLLYVTYTLTRILADYFASHLAD